MRVSLAAGWRDWSGARSITETLALTGCDCCSAESPALHELCSRALLADRFRLTGGWRTQTQTGVRRKESEAPLLSDDLFAPNLVDNKKIVTSGQG